MNFNTLNICKNKSWLYNGEGWAIPTQPICDVTNARNIATMRIIVEGEKCVKCGQQNPDHHINDCQFPCKCANCGSNHPVYTSSCESWRQKKEVLTVKHQNNIVIFWPSPRPKNAIPRWYTGRKWHIPMASNRKRLCGRIKAYDMGQGEGPIVPLQWCTGRE